MIRDNGMNEETVHVEYNDMVCVYNVVRFVLENGIFV